MEFARKNPKLAYTVSIATIILVVIFNILYFIFAPIQSQGNPKNFKATPIIEHPSVAPTAPETAVGNTSPLSILSLSILLVIVLLFIVIIFAVLKFNTEQRKKRDEKRREDLKRLAQAFEAYKLEHGLYPLSSTYQPQYYTGINLSKDWNYYGLPDKEHMARFLPDWPVSDPSIDYNSKNQVNQYLYYPKDNGRKFFLYAHLEAPTKAETIDYNSQDNLLRSWGAYNYRVESGVEQPVNVEQPHPEHPKIAGSQTFNSGQNAIPPQTTIQPVTSQSPTEPAQTQESTVMQPAAPAAQATPVTTQSAAEQINPNANGNMNATFATPSSPVAHQATEQASQEPIQPPVTPSQADAVLASDSSVTQNMGSPAPVQPQPPAPGVTQAPESQIEENTSQQPPQRNQ